MFAMAASVCEEIATGPEAWRALEVRIVPGITAMLAVAARAGAPLGHDFCAISLSDNLKPWELVVKRLDAAASAGFVVALYNPVSRARPWQLGDALARLARHLPDATPVIFGRAVGREEESVVVTSLAEAPGIAADMATLVIVGSAETRIIRARGPRASRLYAARRREGHRMIEPGKRILDRRRDALCFRQRGALQHDHRKMQGARRGDLAVGRVAAAVLGDDARRCDGARAARDPLPR